MCCGTPTMCASCQKGNITPPAPCVAEHRPCVQVARTVTSPHPPHVVRNIDHVCKLPERSHHPPPPHVLRNTDHACVQVARTVTSPHPTPCVAEHRPCVRKLPERQRHPPTPYPNVCENSKFHRVLYDAGSKDIQLVHCSSLTSITLEQNIGLGRNFCIQPVCYTIIEGHIRKWF